MSDRPPRQHLEILDKADGVIRALEQGELTAQDVAARLNEPISSVYRIIHSLTAIDWVMPGSARGKYRLGLQILSAGSAFIDSLDMRALLHPGLLRLRDATMLTVYLCVPSNDSAVCIERVAGHGVRSLDLIVGGLLPLNRGGASKAILAALPPEDAEAISTRLTVDTAQATALRTELAETRARGYAISDGDVTKGIAAYGAAIYDHLGRVAGSVSLGGLRDDVWERTDVIAELLATAQRSSELLGWDRHNG